MKDEIKEILDKMERLIVYGQYNAYYDLEKQLLDYITNLQKEENKLIAESTEWESKYYDLQEENERLKRENYILKEYEDKKLNDYKSRNEKANWWLKKMLKQVKSDETKAIINGTLELLLNGGVEE